MAIAAVSFGSSFAMFESETTQLNAQSESSFMTGHVDVVVRDGETGEIKAYRSGDNDILNGGMDLMTELLFNTNSTGFGGALSHIEVGTGSTAPDGTDTGIETVITDCARVATTNTSVVGTSDPGSIVVTSTAQIDAGADVDCAVSGISEAVIFNAVTTGDPFARNTFSGVTLAGTDTLDITWTFTFTDT